MTIRDMIEEIKLLENQIGCLRSELDKKVLDLAENYRKIFHLFPSDYLTNIIGKGIDGYRVYWGFWSHEYRDSFDDYIQNSLFDELPDFLELTIDELENPKKTIEKWIKLKMKLIKKKSLKDRRNEQ